VSSFEERRRARQSWPIRVVPLAEEGRPDPRDTTTVGERVALVWALTCEQWASSGRAIPTYSRADMPGTIVLER
jgi:hypothetical protein